MGRTRKLRLKGGKGECSEPTYSMMKYHLYADMKHDHGAAFFTDLPAAISLISDDATFSVAGTDTSEQGMYSQILQHFPATNADVRKANIVRFKLDNATSLLPAKPIFTPFAGIPNNQVGVLQDAGFLLYNVIGATNFITYGSILDQAGKPREDAFFFKVPDGTTVDIPSCMIGFNENRVGPIKISNFKGDSVVCKIQYKYQKNSISVGGTPDSGLKLNSLGGDFQSNATVKSSQKETKFRLAIGKALGDALQVISLVPNANPFLTIGGNAVPLEGTAPPRVILKAIMNTGDKLNHARAYALGVGSVFSPPSINGVRECEYIPGYDSEVTLPQMFTLYMTRILDLIVKSDLAYEELSIHLLTLSKTFDTNSSFKSGQPLITLPTGIERARYILQGISLVVNAIRTYIMAYFKASVDGFIKFTPDTATPEILNLMKTTYEKLVTEANGLMPSHTSTVKLKGSQNNIIEAITICKVKGVLPYSDTPLTVDAKNSIDTFMATIRPGRISNPLPPTTVVGGIKSTIVFYISNIYQLLGKNSKIGSPYSKIFEIVQFEGINPSGLLVPAGSVDEARQIGEIFGQKFVKSTQLPVTGGGGIIGGQEEMDEPQNDLFRLFIKYSESQGQSWYTILNDAFRTYLTNPFSIVDDVLFKELYGSTIAYYGEPAEKAFNDIADAVQTLVLMKSERSGPVTRSMAAKQLERFNVHTYSSLFINEFSMLYNASIIGDIGVDADNDYYNVLMAYHDEFVKLRSGVDNLMYFFETPVAGGQRVSLENLDIDETKSFVKSVGGSPRADVK